MKPISHHSHRLLQRCPGDSIRLNLRFATAEGANLALHRVLTKLPGAAGKPIGVCFRPSLTAHRGKLLSRKKTGMAVHAGSFIRKRQIVLETELLESRNELTRIFLHELSHFAWTRLGNKLRRSYEAMLITEIRDGARGELGWSAEHAKQKLAKNDSANRNVRWRDYAAESFCDTAAWFFGSLPSHPEYTLARTHRERRRRWFQRILVPRGIAL